MKHSPGFLKLVEDAKTRIQAKAQIQRGEATHILLLFSISLLHVVKAGLQPYMSACVQPLVTKEGL